MAELQVVKESSTGELTYPPDLPKDRSSVSRYCASSVTSLLVAASGFLVYDQVDSYQDTVIFLGVAATNCISCCFILHVVIKMCTFMEDYRNHLHTRHNDNVFELTKKALSFNVPSVLVGGFSTILAPWSWHVYGWEYMCMYGLKPLLPIIAATFLLQWVVKMEWSALEDSILIGEMNGMDHGSGMAHSFFYGYLHIILPVTGDANKGIRERIDDYISKEGLSDSQFPVKKLFILIPSSTYITCTLDELGDGWILPAKSLEEQQFDVAGVRARSYKNSVYKIRDPQLDATTEYVYVVAEGATPLRTLNEVVVRSVRKSGFRTHQKEIIHMFFKTLRKILREDERTKNNCEIIYYVDKDEHGDNVNIGKLILQRIQEIEEKRIIKALQSRA